jgi:hypothetical protein
VRFTCLRWLTYGIAFAVPALAQPIPLSHEMPRVEASVGAGAVYGGASTQVERKFTEFGLNHGGGLSRSPQTSPTDFFPVFAQLQLGVREHTMVGYLTAGSGTDTMGRAADGGMAYVHAATRSRALLVSYRPNPWIRVGAGPALHRRTLIVNGSGDDTRLTTLGWVGSADVKFARRALTYEHPPSYGYVTAQYRGMPALRVPPGSLSVGDKRSLPWPGQRVGFSHWLIGVGVGFEI